MSCGCSITCSSTYGETYYDITSTRLISLGAIVCEECSKPIPKGVTYSYDVGWDLDYEDREVPVQAHRTCQSCEAARRRFCCDWTYGLLWEDIYDAIQQLPEGEEDLDLCCLEGLSQDAAQTIVEWLDELDEEEI